MKVSAGYAYLEVLVAAVLIAAALVPAADAVRDAVYVSERQRDHLSLQYLANGRLEATLAETFSILETEATTTGGTTPSQFSDPVGADPRVLVFVAPHDIDNDDLDNDPLTGTDAGVVRIRAVVEDSGVEFSTLVGSAS